MTTETYHLTWADVMDAADKLAARQAGNAHRNVYGIPTGGAPVAVAVAARLGLPLADDPVPGKTLVVDDLVDTGTTLERFAAAGHHVDALYRKPYSPAHLAPHATTIPGWIAFPWERDDGAPTDAVVRLLQHLGEDPTRDGLHDTPKRVCKALRELTAGYALDPAVILERTFDVHHDEMIVVAGVPYVSLCEHHMLPFTGAATIGYVPRAGARIVGLSKLPRLLDCFARRLQVQERLTNQIAQALVDHLDPRAVGVVVTGHHTCMSARGIQRDGEMVTSALLGDLRTDSAMRAEFMALSHVNRR